MNHDLAPFNSLKPYDALLRFAPFEFDRLGALRVLMTYPMIQWVNHNFSRTRDGATELYFVRYCRGIIEESGAELSAEEVESFDRELTHFELSAYDRLNWWQEYVVCFEEARSHKQYTIEYAAWANHPGMEKYLLWQTMGHKHVHFLFASHQRYEIVKRKLDRLNSGKTTKHLERRQMEDLTEEQLNKRYIELLRLFNFLTQQQESSSDIPTSEAPGHAEPRSSVVF